MAKTHLRLVAPTTVKQTVAQRRRPNVDYRSREHLTEAEIEKLIEATKGNRYGHRDATMVLVAYRHGLRASGLVTLRWDQIDFAGGILHVIRRNRRHPYGAGSKSGDHDNTNCLCDGQRPRYIRRGHQSQSAGW